MPFTFSHPAAVLPMTFLPKRWYSMTGLIVGSLCPDFEYFLRMRVYSSYSHTWAGLFWFDLPLTIILALIYHLIIRDRFIGNSPTFLKSRLIMFRQLQWIKPVKESFPIFIISCIVGSATHILWDGFTHHGGYFVQTINALDKNVTLAGHLIPVYKVLQHTSSLIGGLIIVYSVLRMPRHRNVSSDQGTILYWSTIFLTAATIFLLRILTASTSNHIGDLITTVIAGGLIGIILASALIPARVNGR